jgi:large subunit ribosomal protein L3
MLSNLIRKQCTAVSSICSAVRLNVSVSLDTKDVHRSIVRARAVGRVSSSTQKSHSYVAAQRRFYLNHARVIDWQKRQVTPEEAARRDQEVVRKQVEISRWSRDTRRVGLVCKKLGMMQLYDARGEQFAVTALEVDDNQVVQTKPQKDTKGRVGVQLGAGHRALKKTKKPQLGHFASAGVDPKHKLVEFRVSPDAALPEGLRLDARHFVPGQFVDVRGITKGKGFAGVMKRWGFSGGFATHGNSLAHRAAGGIGAAQDPGNVWKGKKMAGRMGSKQVCMQNMQLYRINVPRNLLFVRGCVPGNAGGYVVVTDAIKKQVNPDNAPPVPTFVPTEEDEAVEDLYAPLGHIDPFAKL